MMERREHPQNADSVESAMRLQLAGCNALASSAEPVLRHLLMHGDAALFSQDVLARLRAMLADLARQLVADSDPSSQVMQDLLQVPGLLRHLHALALEWACAMRLQDRLGLDPVLSPLFQALIASADSGMAARAMQALAAQARFAQHARRMQLPCQELPAELLHAVCTLAPASAELRAGYDEAATRLGLLAQLVEGLGAGAMATLALSHAGVALFACGVAAGGHIRRDDGLLAMHDGQWVRLALTLRAGGVKLSGVEETLQALHPLAALPEGLARIAPERAAEILADGPLPGGKRG